MFDSDLGRSSKFERRYYVAAAIVVVIVVLAGFSIDVPLLSHPDRVSVLVRAHGLIMLTWIALFFTQALLVARHRVDLHMRLGIAGAVLAVVVVVADTATLQPDPDTGATGTITLTARF